MHLLGGVWQQFADVCAGDGGLNRLERPAGVGVRLRVPRLKLTDAAGEEDHQHALLRLAQFLRRKRVGEATQTQRGGCAKRYAKKAAARNSVVGSVASVSAGK